MTPDEFNIRLGNMSETLYREIETVLETSGLDKRELANLLATGEFDNLIAQLGIEELVAQYVNELDDVVFDNGFTFPAGQLESTVRDLEQMKTIRFGHLLGKASNNAEFFKQTLIDSLFQENGNQIILDKLRTIPLNDAQINTVVSTGHADFARTATALAYQDDPQQRFKYVGTLNFNTGAEECNWLLQNQRKEGYTKAEIDQGISTPFYYKSGDKKGQQKMIYWNGRLPNFNCDDEWLPI